MMRSVWREDGMHGGSEAYGAPEADRRILPTPVNLEWLAGLDVGSMNAGAQANAQEADDGMTMGEASLANIDALREAVAGGAMSHADLLSHIATVSESLNEGIARLGDEIGGDGGADGSAAMGSLPAGEWGTAADADGHIASRDGDADATSSVLAALPPDASLPSPDALDPDALVAANPMPGEPEPDESAPRVFTAWDRVELARDPARPTARQIIESMAEGFLEMHGDRYYADDPAIVGGIGWFAGRAVTFIGQDKGVGTREKVRCNFGSPHPEGYRKALRLMRQADKFGRPIVCIVDTQGAFCGVGAEERGQGEAIARNLMEMSTFGVPVIAVLIGEGGSGGALALAVANRIAMLENALYSILSPEGFASILWKDASRAQEAAGVMGITAQEVQALGIVEDILPEPEGGAQADVAATVATIRAYLREQLDGLCAMSAQELREQRYQRFRRMGDCG